jgi:murein DD-endopeptidase MepM/ murein hydrolase activator NlpD
VLRFIPWLSLVALLLVAPDARAGSWLRPVDGALLRAFAVGRDPYAGGVHRGVDLAGARGSPVRSACSGQVSFAGRVPRGGQTVSVRCGAIVATFQQLGSIAVGAGRGVGRGARIGTIGASSDPRERRSHVHLGARVLATGRYLDPLDLLGALSPGAPLLPPAGSTRPRPAPLGPAPVSPRGAPLRPAPAVPRLAALRPAPAAPGIPPGSRLAWTVWVGLACAGLALPVGGLVHLRRRRQATSHFSRIA